MMMRVELEGVAVEGGRLSIWRAERAMIFGFLEDCFFFRSVCVGFGKKGGGGVGCGYKYSEGGRM